MVSMAPKARMHPVLLTALVLAAAAVPATAEESHSLIVTTAFFDAQSASLSNDDIKVLGMMADLIKADPSYKVRVAAYTDPVDEDAKDKDLAKSRAEAVRDYMVGKGASKDQISIKGEGDKESFGNDTSDTDRALRRRAEIRVRQEDREKRAIDAELERSADTKVQTTVFFDFDKSDVKPEFKGMLERLGKMLQGNPNYKVRVFGHTDGQGKADYNLALGNRRCEAVMAELTKAGAAATAVEKASMGQTETIGDQAMAATTSRALSRSVEIKVIKIGGPDGKDDGDAPKDGKDKDKKEKKDR